jgi:hypothetical protein
MPFAQINVGRFRARKADPVNADFMAALDPVNAQADAADGFLWRLVEAGNNAIAVEARPGDPDFIVNMSVWRDVAALETFVYRHADHRAMLARRHEWFDRTEPVLALWEVPEGHTPSIAEGMAKLAELAEHGPCEAAFTFRWWRENRKR